MFSQDIVDLKGNERVFSNADVSRIAGISLRQLQWRDELMVVSPGQENQRRVYGGQEVLEILAVAALRQKPPKGPVSAEDPACATLVATRIGPTRESGFD